MNNPMNNPSNNPVKSRRARLALAASTCVLVFLIASCGSGSDGGAGGGDTSTASLSASFKTNCGGCHGSSGAGGSAPSLRGYARNKTSFQSQVRNGGGGMPAFSSDTYSDADLTADYTWLISN